MRTKQTARSKGRHKVVQCPWCPNGKGWFPTVGALGQHALVKHPPELGPIPDDVKNKDAASLVNQLFPHLASVPVPPNSTSPTRGCIETPATTLPDTAAGAPCLESLQAEAAIATSKDGALIPATADVGTQLRPNQRVQCPWCPNSTSQGWFPSVASLGRHAAKEHPDMLGPTLWACIDEVPDKVLAFAERMRQLFPQLRSPQFPVYTHPEALQDIGALGLAAETAAEPAGTVLQTLPPEPELPAAAEMDLHSAGLHAPHNTMNSGHPAAAAASCWDPSLAPWRSNTTLLAPASADTAATIVPPYAFPMPSALLQSAAPASAIPVILVSQTALAAPEVQCGVQLAPHGPAAAAPGYTGCSSLLGNTYTQHSPRTARASSQFANMAPPPWTVPAPVQRSVNANAYTNLYSLASAPAAACVVQQVTTEPMVVVAADSAAAEPGQNTVAMGHVQSDGQGIKLMCAPGAQAQQPVQMRDTVHLGLQTAPAVQQAAAATAAAAVPPLSKRACRRAAMRAQTADILTAAARAATVSGEHNLGAFAGQPDEVLQAVQQIMTAEECRNMRLVNKHFAKAVLRLTVQQAGRLGTCLAAVRKLMPADCAAADNASAALAIAANAGRALSGSAVLEISANIQHGSRAYVINGIELDDQQLRLVDNIIADAAGHNSSSQQRSARNSVNMPSSGLRQATSNHSMRYAASGSSKVTVSADIMLDRAWDAREVWHGLLHEGFAEYAEKVLAKCVMMTIAVYAGRCSGHAMSANVSKLLCSVRLQGKGLM